MDSTINNLEKDSITDTTCVTIGVASPDTIKSWSYGEVKNPETINYRTFKPEKGGLFCEKIFGPTHDWECACGKYKRIRHKGVVCDRCGVEVTLARVRRERMGHLELAVPVSHVWFFKVMPSRIGTLLDIQGKPLESVLYYENWIVTDSGMSPLKHMQLLTDGEYREAMAQYVDEEGKPTFTAQIGAEAIETLLRQLDLPKLKEELTEQLNTKSKALRKKVAKRIRLVEGFLEHNMDPTWMILKNLPVIPPELRPLVPLEGGRFATSDLNDLYRRVINRNNRLKNLLQLHTPEVIIRNEKRMLQEAVDALLDNGRHGRAVTGTGNRNLKSLTDMLKGKQGRFRQNLLGKRVDYSGRSVIVVGPELRINQCGLPKEMALVLFEPFIMRKLKERGLVHTVRNAKKWIEERRREVWDILDEVIKGHPILLNRAPTLHRLSIQAFDPILIEGQAIRLHPLVCTAFNADFDGDQMAVHVPLSNEAQLEAKLLMLSPNNIFSPASGKPTTTPTQDITLGVYYLTYEDKHKHAKFDALAPVDRPVFRDLAEVLRAKDAGQVSMHDFFYLLNPFYQKDTTWNKECKDQKFIVTTCGRCIFNDIWPKEMGFYNAKVTKKQLGSLITDCYETIGRSGLIRVLDALKDIGYEYATWAGFSIGIQDMIVPEEKKQLIAEAEKQVEEIRKQNKEGEITRLERYNKTIDVWTKVNSVLSDKLVGVLEENLGRDEINPVFAMLDSGARGSKDQIRQLAGMRGLMSKPSGEVIESPILANFREGLTVLEYFISSHGARKGLADTALKTADSGYMTRRLVDVAHDVICVEEDCGTVNGIWSKGQSSDGGVNKRIIGRFSVDDIIDPETGDKIVGVGEEITSAAAKKIAAVGLENVHIRSVLTCESAHGICAKCYGRNLATGEMPLEGDPLGIIAAQSIGEPGTQLTMRTFHQGGTAATGATETSYTAKHSGRLRVDVTPVPTSDGHYVVLTKSGFVAILNENEEELERTELVAGAILTKTTGDMVEEGEKFMEWDAYNIPIISEKSGIVHYDGLIEGTTFQRQQSAESSGKEQLIVMEVHREDVHPSIIIVPEGLESERKAGKSTRKTTKSAKSKKAKVEEVVSEEEQLDGSITKALPAGAYITVADGQHVNAGDTIAKTPRQSQKTKDITGGLPRVAELFEARRPKRAAEIARIDGIATIEKAGGRLGGSIIRVTDMETNEVQEHKIPSGKQIIVNNDDFVHKGDPLTDGDRVLHDLLEVCGQQEMQEHLVNAVQDVYTQQSVDINDKHIEIIVRQMMRRVRITEPGTTRFLYGESVDKYDFEQENARVIAEGGVQAEATPMLQGITKAALATDSFISAASFQDTTRVLTEAATLGRVDSLRGFKENVIMGRLIPSGTGYHKVQNCKLEFVGNDTEGAVPASEQQSRKDKEDLQDMKEFVNI